MLKSLSKKFLTVALGLSCLALCACKQPSIQFNTSPTITGITAQTSSDSITLTWSNPGEEDFSYTEVTFTPSSKGTAQPIKAPGNAGLNTRYPVKDLESNQTYNFFLTAVYDNGKRDPAIAFTATTTDPDKSISDDFGF